MGIEPSMGATASRESWVQEHDSLEDEFNNGHKGPMGQQFDVAASPASKKLDPRVMYKMKALPIQMDVTAKSLINVGIDPEGFSIYSRLGETMTQFTPHESSFLARINYEDIDGAKFFSSSTKRTLEKHYLSLKFKDKGPIDLAHIIPDIRSKARRHVPVQSNLLLLEAKEKKGLQAIKTACLRLHHKQMTPSAAESITSPKTKELEWAAAAEYWEGRSQEHAELRTLESDEKRLQGLLEAANKDIFDAQQSRMRGIAGVEAEDIDNLEKKADDLHDALRETQNHIQQMMERKMAVVKAVAKNRRQEAGNGNGVRSGGP